MTTDRKNFIFSVRRGIMAEIEYPGIAKLVSRLVWDQETVRSSRTTRTKIPLKSLISEGFSYSLSIAAQEVSLSFLTHLFDKHNRAYFLRVQPDDLKDTLSQIFYVLSNLSWISNFDEDYIRESFQERAKATLADIYAKITTSSTDEVSSDAGEYVVSELAREAIVDKLGYLDIPLAELYNKKKSGNPGFDFHSQSLDEVIIFGEAKYLDDRNAYGSGLKQVVRFISDKKDIKDLADLRDFCSQNALSSVSKGMKGFAVAFSAKSTPSDTLVSNIIKNKDFISLLQHQEIIIVAVNI